MKKFWMGLAAMATVIWMGTADASDWSLYGSARMATFWQRLDLAGDRELQWDLQDNSHVGAKVEAGAVKGQLELELSPNGAGVAASVLYGEWDFGPGDLLVGQENTPVNMFYSGQAFGADNGLTDTGAASNDVRPMIRLRFGDPWSPGSSFQIAAVNVHAESDLGTGGDVDVLFPKIEARYTVRREACYAEAFGGFQTFRIQQAPASSPGGEVDVDAFVLGLGVGVFLGPVEIAATGYFGRNLGPYGLLQLGDADPRINAAGDGIVDNETWAGMVAVRYKATDRIGLEAGYGMIRHDLDDTVVNKDDAHQYYLHAVCEIAGGVWLIPEVGIIDEKEDFNGVDEEETFYLGAKWQIDF